ncbi:hypothetical protein [Pseudomonas lini]
MSGVMTPSRASRIAAPLAPTGPPKQGISGRFDGLFFCLKKANSYIRLKYNQMNKYDLWIYKSAVKVAPPTRDRKPRIANTVQGIV